MQGLGIELCGRTVEGGACRLHVGRAGEERTYIEASHGDGQKAHGAEHGEASADVVVDDECVCSLRRWQANGAPAVLVGDGYNALAGFPACLVVLLSLALSRRKAMAGSVVVPDLDMTIIPNFFVPKQLLQFVEIVLADIFVRQKSTLGPPRGYRRRTSCSGLR